MDGRECLKVAYPADPEIWDTAKLPKDDPNKWEYNKDINSRPLFANFVGADALFNLHTNASTTPSATGTRAFVAMGRSYDLELANNVLCGMKELIHAKDAYKNFNVASQAQASGKYGENNKAVMPAMVLEVAFHTNPADATALQDPIFVNAAMKGVEKGFRLQVEGKTCTPFRITNIPDATIQRPNSKVITVAYKGFPYFPVTMTIDNLVCPDEDDCTGGTVQFSKAPLRIQLSCPGSSSTTDVSRWSTYLTDVDGVKTNAFEHEITCTPNAVATIGKGKPSISVGPVVR
jgi:hypothetical protein